MDIPRSTYYYQGKENNGKLPQEIFLKGKNYPDCLLSSLLWLSENNSTTGEGEDQG